MRYSGRTGAGRLPAQVVVGVTGKYCAGKSNVTRTLVERGFRAVDVDQLGHVALRECRERVLARFGDDLRRGDSVDRARLGEIVFRDRKARCDLERILYPAMVPMVRKLIAATPGAVVIDAALLYRIGLQSLCHLVVWVAAPLRLRLRRARRRDGRSLQQILRIMRAQRDVRRPSRGAPPPVLVVVNRGDPTRLAAQVGALIEDHEWLRPLSSET